MPKKIIICCDGTGNEIKENQSNVLKFYRVLKEDKSQIAFYDPGIGTISNSGAWSAFKHQAKGVFGLATGYGLDRNILDAYKFLVTQYKDGDQVYLFGFSRGAYTVRALAGLINLVGVLQPHQIHLSSYALTAYKQSQRKENFRIGWRVQEVLDSTHITIRFMGCWDTVGSVIVPRPDRFYIPALEALPYTNENPCVQTFRHAIAVDEKRRMFRVSRWKEPQLFKSNPFVKDDKAKQQDIKQVWFSGVHSDVGGGYPEEHSGTAKIPLAWMVDEAKQHGLVFREVMVKRLVHGKNPKNSTRNYTAPNSSGKLHDSMNWAWKVLEYFPKRKKYHDDPKEADSGGVYIPNSEPRYISEDADIHPSVWERVNDGSLAKRYEPENLPPRN